MSNKHNIKAKFLAVLVFFVAGGGCAVQKQGASSNYPVDGSANKQEDVLVGQDSSGSDEEAGLSDDGDFDLFEDELVEQKVEIWDPLEPWNRMMYHVNDGLYFWLLKPVGQGYKAVVPRPARVGIGNFFANLTTPIRFFNCLLQGKGEGAKTELSRFAVNTTAGVLGFGDPARDRLGLEPYEEDLGQSLAVHGVGNGFYIVWPLLGPSTLRDSFGLAGDQFLNPTRYVEPRETSVAISAVKFTNESSFHIGEYESFKSAALEPYVAMRRAYIQYRDKQIKQ